MKIDVNVEVHHISRVEGHGNIVVRVKNGRIEESRWETVETPRFFEVLLKGKHFTSAGILAARICGICSIAHCIASVRATEKAFGVEVPEFAAKLRLVAKHGETLQSHVLHLVFLAAPDFLGLPSAIPLMEQQPELFALAARLKGLANRICDAVAGRATHPVSIQVGGMARVPAKAVLSDLRDELTVSLVDLRRLSEVFASFEIPPFVRETEFVSLKGETTYPWIGDEAMSSDGVQGNVGEYRALTNEYVTDKNTSKWCKLSRDSFAVGALARFNNNWRLLTSEARNMASEMGLTAPCHNPFMSNTAQLVECAHLTSESIRLIDEILNTAGVLENMVHVEPRAGEGVGAVEAPRGILYHHYEYGNDGRIVRANCVIPTTQNNANIQADIASLVEQCVERGSTDQEVQRLCCMLVRAYDPCLSCSVH